MGFCELIARLNTRFIPYDETFNTTYSTTPALPSASTAKAHIPTEIIMTILDSASRRENETRDTQLLTSCALVSRDWSVLAQKLLFRRVSLTRISDFRAFQGGVDRFTPRGRMLRNTITHLHCIVDVNQPDGLTWQEFVQAVLLCPKLSEVSLAVYGAPQHEDKSSGAGSLLGHHRDWNSMSLLRQGPQVTSLSLDNWSGEANVLSQLLDAWPSISSLSIGGNTSILPAPPTSSTPVLPKLRRLRVNLQSSPSLDVLSWLLTNSLESLEALDFQREPCTETLVSLLRTHGTHLTSLTLPSCASPARITALAECSSLSALRIRSAGPLSPIIRALRPSLQHLAFAIDKESEFQCVVQAIKSNDTLETVTVYVGVDAERHPQLAAVRIACAVRGVKLCVVKDVQVPKETPFLLPEVPSSSNVASKI